MKKIVFLTLMLLVTGCGWGTSRRDPRVVSTAPPNETSNWWDSAIFYEIFVRSFYDTDADGIGDFNGIRAKLDYLNDGDPTTNNDLGITGIWMMPIFLSPTYHGYDVTDYYTVNPEYGSMEDFKSLVQEAHRRGIRVIIDLVINHTSSQNPWFIQSNKNPDSPYRNWYVWSVNPPDGAGWRPGEHGFYYAYFDPTMPDLNFREPQVTNEINKIVKFWLTGVGVDGFRIDAAKHLFEDGDIRENAPETYTWFKEFYKSYKAVNAQAYTVGEVYGAGSHLVQAYSDDKMDQVFNFEIASGILNSVKGEASSGITSAVKFTQMDMPGWDFATFLTNHDQDRVMDVLGGSVEKAKLAATLLLTLPGTPFIYYGEEIGMRGVKPDEDIRRPMQWTENTPSAGFTTGTPWRPLDSTNLSVYVEQETGQAGSLLNHYRRLIALRQKEWGSGTGKVDLVDTGDPGVFAFIQHQNDKAIIVFVNLTHAPVSDYNLALSDSLLTPGTYILSSLWDPGLKDFQVSIEENQNGFVKPLGQLAPYSTHIFAIKLK